MNEQKDQQLFKLYFQEETENEAKEPSIQLDHSHHHSQSFQELLGSTLKYLYLTFSPDHVLPLEQWVFYAHGQPLPICGRNTRAYPMAKCGWMSKVVKETKPK
mgnify:CR=1 FL=1